MTARQQAELLQQHPLSAAFPSMPEQELQALALDIEKHGQREPGVMFEGKVLDGWHRYLACQAANVKFKAEEYGGDDPVAFVISRNLHRRHLTASQRAQAVVEATNWRSSAGRPRNGEATSPLSTKSLAQKAEVSERTIEQAKKVQQKAPDLAEKVKAGEVSVERAAKAADLPPGKREKAINRPSEKRPSGDAAKLQARIKELEEALSDSEEKREAAADAARELEDKLTAFEKTEPDEQQKEIMRLQKRVVKLEGEVEHQKRRANDLQAKCNELIREVKRLRKNG